MHRARWGERARGFHVLSEHATFPKQPRVHQPGSYPNPFGFFFFIFMEFLLLRRDWLAISDWFNLQLLSSSWSSGGQTKSSNLLILWLCHLININPVSGKWLVINHKTPIPPLCLWRDFRNWGQDTKHYNKRCSHWSYHSGSSKGFGKSESGTVNEDWIYMRNRFWLSEWPNTYFSKLQSVCSCTVSNIK